MFVCLYWIVALYTHDTCMHATLECERFSFIYLFQWIFFYLLRLLSQYAFVMFSISLSHFLDSLMQFSQFTHDSFSICSWCFLDLFRLYIFSIWLCDGLDLLCLLSIFALLFTEFSWVSGHWPSEHFPR